MNEQITKRDVWEAWIGQYVDTDDPVPLFETDSSGGVVTKAHGTDNRPILKRSNEMEALLAREGAKVVDD